MNNSRAEMPPLRPHSSFWYRSLRGMISGILSLFPPSTPRFVYTVLLRWKPLRSLTNTFLRSMIPRTIEIPEGTIVLNPDDPVVSGALMLGVHEPTFRRLFTEAITPGMTVIDIGANIGYYTLIASKRTGATGSVISFEPEEVNATILERMIAENALTNVSVSRVAIGASDEEATLYLDPNNKGKHTLVPTPGNTSTNVRTQRLTSALTPFPVQRIDLIKMDIEGWEAKAFCGMWEIVERDRPELFLEFAPQRIRHTDEDPVMLLQKIRDLGYELSEINDGKRQEVPILSIGEYATSFRHFDDYSDIHARVRVPRSS